MKAPSLDEVNEVKERLRTHVGRCEAVPACHKACSSLVGPKEQQGWPMCVHCGHTQHVHAVIVSGAEVSDTIDTTATTTPTERALHDDDDHQGNDDG